MGRNACQQGKNFRAKDTETLVWSFVSGLLKDPDRLRRGLDEMLMQERELASCRPAGEEETWLKKLAELDAQEERLLDLYLDGKLEANRYDSRVAEIKRSRKTVQDELAHIQEGGRAPGAPGARPGCPVELLHADRAGEPRRPGT